MNLLNFMTSWLVLSFALCQSVNLSDCSPSSECASPYITGKFNYENSLVCPRCRRAEPKGPRKRPSPRYDKGRQSSELIANLNFEQV